MVDNLFLFNKVDKDIACSVLVQCTIIKVDKNDEYEPNYLRQKRIHLKQTLCIRFLPDGLRNVINPVRRSYLFIERILLENRPCNEKNRKTYIIYKYFGGTRKTSHSM